MVTAIKLYLRFISDVAWYLKEQFTIKTAIELARKQMEIRRREIKLNQVTKSGAKAYINGKGIEDNPFDKETHPLEFKAWRGGFLYAEHSGMHVRKRIPLKDLP